jgi:flotillin
LILLRVKKLFVFFTLKVEQQEIMRREEELVSTVRLPAEAEAFRLQTIAEGKR